MDALDRTLRDRLSRAAEEMASRPVRAGSSRGLELAPRRTLRPLAAAVALAALIAAAGTGVGLHARLGGTRHSVNPPASTPPPAAPTAVPTPANQGPLGIRSGPMAWDSTHGTLVVVDEGGDSPKDGAVAGNTWTWQGGRWSQHGDAGLPPNLGSLVLADMPALHGVVLIGEQGSGVWLWNGSAWARAGATPWDSTQSGANAAAWDAQRRLLVVVVGTRLSGDMMPPPQQTWTWNGRTWANRGDAPLLAGNGDAAWDPQTRSVVLVGTPYYSVTSVGTATAWTWTGSAWRKYGTPATYTYSSYALGVAWDSTAGALLSYLSSTVDDGTMPGMLVIRDGRWQRSVSSSYPADAVRLVADTGDGRALLVVVPHSGDQDAVYTWNGHAWQPAP